MDEQKSLLKLGFKAKQAGNYDEAIKYFMQMVEQGNTDGMAAMGMLYENGEGVEQDLDKAMEWYQKVIDADDADGWWFRGKVLFYQDENEQAIQCFEKSIAGGGSFVRDSEYYLGVMYEGGYGVEQDYTKAVEYYKHAAEKYGICCIQIGNGLPQRRGRGAGLYAEQEMV